MNNAAQLFLFDLGPATVDHEAERRRGIAEKVDHDLAMWGTRDDDGPDFGDE